MPSKTPLEKKFDIQLRLELRKLLTADVVCVGAKLDVAAVVVEAVEVVDAGIIVEDGDIIGLIGSELLAILGEVISGLI